MSSCVVHPTWFERGARIGFRMSGRKPFLTGNADSWSLLQQGNLGRKPEKETRVHRLFGKIYHRVFLRAL